VYQVEVFCVVMLCRIVVRAPTFQRNMSPSSDFTSLHREDEGRMDLWNVGVLTTILHNITTQNTLTWKLLPWKPQNLN